MKEEDEKNEKIKSEKSFLTYFANIGLDKEQGYFIENLSMLIANGMPIINALDAISQELKLKRMKKIVSSIKSDTEAGSPLWKSLSKSSLFPDYAISLIKLGEESGRFAENLRVVALEQEKNRLFKSKIRSAMMYPIFVFVLTMIIGIGISWFILPKLSTVFDQLNIDLPLVTRVLISIGIFFSNYGLFVVPIIILLTFVIFFFLFSFAQTKWLGQWILLVIPGVKELLKEVEISRFGYLLGTLLEAGLPINLAFDSLAGATEINRYRKLYAHMRDSLVKGNTMQQSFSAYKNVRHLFTGPIQQLISIGEQSGTLSETLKKIGESYEIKSDTTTKNLSVILEPVMLVIVWLGVVSVAFAVILPIYSLIGNFQI